MINVTTIFNNIVRILTNILKLSDDVQDKLTLETNLGHQKILKLNLIKKIKVATLDNNPIIFKGEYYISSKTNHYNDCIT